MIVQDNTGTVAGANSYLEVADLVTYHTARGRDLSAYTDAQKEVALVLATDYLDNRFRYKDSKLADGQTTAFPRCEDGIPVAVLNACAEYALVALSGSLWQTPEVDPSGFVVEERESTVGPIGERVKFAPNLGRVLPIYPAADSLLRNAGLFGPRHRVVRD